MAKTTEVAKTESTSIARPDWIPESNAGLEEVAFKDMVIPRMTLCQTNTRQRSKTEPNYIKGLEEGMFFNSVTGRIYGDKVQIVPLFFFHSRIMFKDLDQGGGILCQAPDGKSCQLNAGGPCIHAAWGPGGEPPECTEFFNYPALVYEGPGEATSEWVVVSLKTTGLNAGRNLNSLMRLRRTAAYAGVYELNSASDKNDAGIPYFTWVAKNALTPEGQPMFVDRDLYQRAEGMSKIVYDGLKAGTVKVDNPDDLEFPHVPDNHEV